MQYLCTTSDLLFDYLEELEKRFLSPMQAIEPSSPPSYDFFRSDFHGVFVWVHSEMCEHRYESVLTRPKQRVALHSIRRRVFVTIQKRNRQDLRLTLTLLPLFGNRRFIGQSKSGNSPHGRQAV